jgi:AcrR family transcriptional regulator
MVQQTAESEAARDGRIERGERTRVAVVDALLALIGEGDLRPTAPAIAARAGVSLRTVFHHFEDLEALYATAAERQIQRVVALVRVIPPDLPLEERIDAFVAERAKLHEAITPVRRAALLHEPFSREIAERLRWVRDRGHREAERVFRAELARRPAARRELTEALTVAASWSTWEALRAHRRLAFAQARRTVRRTIAALLKED